MPYMYGPGGDRWFVPQSKVSERLAQGWSLDPPSEPTNEAPSTQLSGNWEVWSIGGKTYLVWILGVDFDANGNPTDLIPLAWQAEANEIRDFGLGDMPISRRISNQEWASMGGVDAGQINQLQRSDIDGWESLVDNFTESANLMPWLEDPEALAVYAEAYAEGWQEWQLQNELYKLDWFQNRNEEEVQWAILLATRPNIAEQLIRDNRIAVESWFEQYGISDYADMVFDINGVSVNVAEWIADMYTKGTWTEVYTRHQIQLLADGDMDALDDALKGQITVLEGGIGVLDTNAQYMAKVRELYNQWLGPMLGAVDDATVREWARRIRDTPDGQDELISFLQGVRLTHLPQYTNINDSYQTIASPYRNLVMNLWGTKPDESEQFFIDLLRLNDFTEAERVLREEGLNRGNETIRTSLYEGLMGAFGGNIARTP